MFHYTDPCSAPIICDPCVCCLTYAVTLPSERPGTTHHGHRHRHRPSQRKSEMVHLDRPSCPGILEKVKRGHRALNKRCMTRYTWECGGTVNTYTLYGWSLKREEPFEDDCAVTLDSSISEANRV